MMNEAAISVKDVVIRYRSFKKLSIKKSLLSVGKNKTEYFEAVKGVSFEVKKGEILGIIGKNGSGKSTLLRAIANIYSPDDGNIDLHGNSVSLLALGVGFQKKLSGRENIILSGMLMGFSEEYVKSKMKSIIKFADIGDFIDKPVSTYSSGMYSKLAFAITATLESNIMLIDEVLSVGDAKFKKKSKKRMMKLIQNKDRTVVIVSHSIGTLRSLCDRMIWLDDGLIKMEGNTDEVLDAYEDYMEE